MKKTILLLSFLSGYLLTSAQVPGYVPTTGLQAWYPFNGNALDESGSGNNLDLYNSPSLTTDRNGMAKSAYQLDGTDDYMITSKSFFNAAQDHSVAMWFRIDDSNRIWQTLYNTAPHRIEGVSYNWFGTKAFNYALGDGSTWTITDDTYNNLDTFTLPVHLEKWNHLVTVKNGLNWYFYVNGAKAYTNLVSGDPLSMLAPLWFGSISYTGYPYEEFGGKMDDIGIWNRALDEDEIKTLYEAKTTAIEAAEKTGSIHIYPTLAQNTLYLTGAIERACIWNSLGQLVKQYDTTISEINIQDLSSGCYLIRVTAPGGDVMTQRFIKQ